MPRFKAVVRAEYVIYIKAGDKDYFYKGSINGKKRLTDNPESAKIYSDQKSANIFTKALRKVYPWGFHVLPKSVIRS